MDIRAVSTLELGAWSEETYQELADAPAMARASATQLFSGDIEGEGRLEILMTYYPDGSASSVGLERVVGRVGGRTGSFVLQHSGSLEDGVAKANLAVVPGSGTHELNGLHGRGWCVRPQGKPGAITLEYSFED
ncbi:DUF3224 domain-containing protein [Solirubrum puertoriconensis]|uniref:DUF3224 domain-containing protein n=1 Tax=Solirubrum puertoriconensis TaxID=1751427 RepID=A0A9X0HJA4_SOLP1|nr:DUF3224 domain-containing protein [Solirubrum puertoriconensis]KUG06947.1 hypothetical protein ASU33_06380 [Solirubrum puertoriconensis]